MMLVIILFGKPLSAVDARAPAGWRDPVRIAALVAVMLLLAACREEASTTKVLRITERAAAANPNAGLSSEPFLADAARVEVTGYPDLAQKYRVSSAWRG